MIYTRFDDGSRLQIYQLPSGGFNPKWKVVYKDNHTQISKCHDSREEAVKQYVLGKLVKQQALMQGAA